MPRSPNKLRTPCPQCGRLYVRLKQHVKRTHGGHSHAGVRMRSGWEVWTAQYLDAQGLPWQYEPHTFRLADGRGYIPDFLVTPPGATPYYIEVKGRWMRGALGKWQQFRREFPSVTVHLWREPELKARGILPVKQRLR